MAKQHFAQIKDTDEFSALSFQELCKLFDIVDLFPKGTQKDIIQAWAAHDSDSREVYVKGPSADEAERMLCDELAESMAAGNYYPF